MGTRLQKNADARVGFPCWATVARMGHTGRTHESLWWAMPRREQGHAVEFIFQLSSELQTFIQ